jgi:hypothetical protein
LPERERHSLCQREESVRCVLDNALRCVLDNALRCGLLKYQDEWLAIPNTKVLGEFV